jgi:hypothetical protein
MIQYSRALVMESKSCGVLGTPLSRSMTSTCGAAQCATVRAVSARRLEPLFGEQPHRGVGVHRLAEREALGVFTPQLIKLDRV